MEIRKGYVDHIVFRNADNGYTVFCLSNEDGELTCVGMLPYISEGELVEVQGEYATHSIYGVQLQVASYEVQEPEDLASIERYLGSGAIKGVGATLAARIVRRFRDETFRIIEEEPERLAEVKGISERMAREIALQVEEKKDMRKAMIYLQKYGITLALAAKIYEHYGNLVYRVLEENPYQLADHVAGVGFKTADEIAARIGIHSDSDYRIRSGIFYVLLQAVTDGHIYLPKEELLQRATALLEVEISGIEQYLMDLSMEKKVVLKQVETERLQEPCPENNYSYVRETVMETRVYAAQYYYMELNTAKMLHDLQLRYDVSELLIEKRLMELEREGELELDEMQRVAVKEAVKNGVFVLTGGPGTGKTTTTNAMIRFFESEGLDIFLAAPTGRAAKRMSEATGCEARTIHRMLELSYIPEGNDNRMQYGRNEENPLEADVIIVDEMSMVDLSLMHTLLKAISVGTRLILVGDKDQLPSVGAGSVLKDLIASKSFPVVTLSKIFRQAEQSDIVVNAHRINRGEQLSLDNKSKDFFFLKRDDANVIISVVLTLIQKKLPNYVGADPLDIQVLTPMRKGLLGVERLNEILQRYLNPPSEKKAEKEYGGRVFRVGDKVMQVKNNYQLEWEIATKYGLVVDKGVGVFNGDIGRIIEINNYTDKLKVEFEEKKVVEYPYEILEELELAYAITIHKSQGSEYPAVVIPLLQGPRQLYHRNLIYTAVTRAKKCVTIVGSDATLREMIDNANVQRRYTSLAERLQEFSESALS
ncbi:MAG: ATP-dependent RecD-like DNA helicase [Faecalimonas sp.]|nr:ATP-dependent RecD-like DNA helicase [Faecalimonas sp.]